MKTINGIYLNLNESDYVYTISYGKFELEFVFSSVVYRDKFSERFIVNRAEINKKLETRWKLPIRNDLLCDIYLYKTIEKRGFLLREDGKDLCLDNIILSGDLLMKNYYNGLSATITQREED